MFGYVNEAVVFWKLWEYKVTQAVSEAASQWRVLDLVVREKARDRNEDWASPCVHRGASPGCGRARLCSPEIRRDNLHISPHPPAPL